MKRILITRSSHQASALAERLRALGLEPILLPTIELADPTTFSPLDAALTSLLIPCGPALTSLLTPYEPASATSSASAARTAPPGRPAFHWLLFTSANAVEAFAKRVPRGFSLGSHATSAKEGTSAPGVCLPPALKIAAIGPATAHAIEHLLGLTPTLIPPQAIAESLAEALLPYALQPPDGSGQATPTRFLLLRAEQARDHLPETLRSAGASVTIAPAYRTVLPPDSIPAIRSLFSAPENYPQAITFTSSSTATNLVALLQTAGLSLPPGIPRISIGPITSKTLRDLRLPPHAEAAEPTIPALADAVVKSLT